MDTFVFFKVLSILNKYGLIDNDLKAKVTLYEEIGGVKESSHGLNHLILYKNTNFLFILLYLSCVCACVFLGILNLICITILLLIGLCFVKYVVIIKILYKIVCVYFMTKKLSKLLKELKMLKDLFREGVEFMNHIQFTQNSPSNCVKKSKGGHFYQIANDFRKTIIIRITSTIMAFHQNKMVILEDDVLALNASLQSNAGPFPLNRIHDAFVLFKMVVDRFVDDLIYGILTDDHVAGNGVGSYWKISTCEILGKSNMTKLKNELSCQVRELSKELAYVTWIYLGIADGSLAKPSTNDSENFTEKTDDYVIRVVLQNLCRAITEIKYVEYSRSLLNRQNGVERPEIDTEVINDVKSKLEICLKCLDQLTEMSHPPHDAKVRLTNSTLNLPEKDEDIDPKSNLSFDIEEPIQDQFFQAEPFARDDLNDATDRGDLDFGWDEDTFPNEEVKAKFCGIHQELKDILRVREKFWSFRTYLAEARARAQAGAAANLTEMPCEDIDFLNLQFAGLNERLVAIKLYDKTCTALLEAIENEIDRLASENKISLRQPADQDKIFTCGEVQPDESHLVTTPSMTATVDFNLSENASKSEIPSSIVPKVGFPLLSLAQEVVARARLFKADDISEEEFFIN